MSKENLRETLLMHMNHLDLFEIEIKKNVSKKDLENVLNRFKKKNWLSDNFRKNLVSILFDNLHMLKNKSIVVLNEFYVN